MNRETVKNLSEALGKNTTAWIGNKINIRIGQNKDRKYIIGYISDSDIPKTEAVK